MLLWMKWSHSLECPLFSCFAQFSRKLYNLESLKALLYRSSSAQPNTKCKKHHGEPNKASHSICSKQSWVLRRNYDVLKRNVH